MKRYFILVGILFFSVNLFATDNQLDTDKVDVQRVLEVLQQRQLQIQEQYDQAQQQCQTSANGFGLNFVGLEPVNDALGSRSNDYCSMAQKLKRTLEFNKLQQMKVALVAQRINSSAQGGSQ